MAVIDYESCKKLWKVLSLDGEQRMFDIPRIYLRFKAEDPMVFACRVRAAIDLRQETEKCIRSGKIR